MHLVLVVFQYANSNVKMIIVGNKCDLEGEREVSPEDGKQVCSARILPSVPL